MSWFFQDAFDPDKQFFYGAWVLTVIISIVLHELAHGWAAIRVGDDTPIRMNRITGNPLVHMGPVSLALVFLMGLGWGAMPVDPTRFRGKYAEAFVAFAGPAMNLCLAILALTALGLWQRFEVAEAVTTAAAFDQSDMVQKGKTFLWVFGLVNILLAMFNLAPVPPLDGSTILANFNRGYRDWITSNAHLAPVLFMGYFIFIGALNQFEHNLWSVSARAAQAWIELFWT